MSDIAINQQTAADVLRSAFEDVVRSQQPAIGEAAELVVDALRRGGIIQVFGTGHSRAFAMEIAGRAGGLVPAHQIALSDLVFYGGAAPSTLVDEKIERNDTVAERLLDVTAIDPADIFIICSNSGGNGSTVELGRRVKEHGHRLIVVTSLDHTTQITSRHPSGMKLFELADVVIDNRGELGDATLELPGGGSILATSSLTGALIAQMLVTEVCGQLLAAGEEVPVLISANVPGGDEHNDDLRAHYAGRLRPSL